MQEKNVQLWWYFEFESQKDIRKEHDSNVSCEILRLPLEVVVVVDGRKNVKSCTACRPLRGGEHLAVKLTVQTSINAGIVYWSSETALGGRVGGWIALVLSNHLLLPGRVSRCAGMELAL